MSYCSFRCVRSVQKKILSHIKFSQVQTVSFALRCPHRHLSHPSQNFTCQWYLWITRHRLRHSISVLTNDWSYQDARNEMPMMSSLSWKVRYYMLLKHTCRSDDNRYSRTIRSVPDQCLSAKTSINGVLFPWMSERANCNEFKLMHFQFSL